MGEQATPTKPGWYPHRYGDEGMESYWNGSEWTGKSRLKPSLFGRSGSGSVGRRWAAFGSILLALFLDLWASAFISMWGFELGLMALSAGTVVWILAAARTSGRQTRATLWVIVIAHVIVCLWLLSVL